MPAVALRGQLAAMMGDGFSWCNSPSADSHRDCSNGKLSRLFAVCETYPQLYFDAPLAAGTNTSTVSVAGTWSWSDSHSVPTEKVLDCGFMALMTRNCSAVRLAAMRRSSKDSS